jgi:hypothetical protein
MPPRADPAARPRRAAARLSSPALALAALAATVALTFAVIHVSTSSGRLRTYPRTDDVIYMARGVWLAEAARTGGIAGLLRDYRADPPHSVYASGLAALGYRLFGPADRSPYLLAGLPALTLMITAVALSRRRRFHERLALTAFAGLLPLGASGIHELKPDYLWGALCAAAVAASLTSPTRLRWKASVLTGALLGLTIYVKTSTLPVTLVLGACCLGLGCFLSGRRLLLTSRRAWGSALLGVAAMALVALPHFALSADRIIGYIHAVIFTPEREVWAFRGSTFQHAVYYITGFGGRLMIGPLLWPMLAVIAAALAVLAGRRRVGELNVALKLGAGLLVTYAIPTLSAVKNGHVGAAFAATLLVCALCAAAFLLRIADVLARRSMRPARRIAFRVLVLALPVVGLLTARWTFYRVDPAARPELRARLDTQRDAVEGLLARVTELARPFPNAPIAVLGGPSHVSHTLVQVRTFTLGVPRRARAVRTADDPALLATTLDRASVVIADNGKTGFTVERRTPPGTNARLLELVRADPRFELVLEAPVHTADRPDGRFFVFVRRGDPPVPVPQRSGGS